MLLDSLMLKARAWVVFLLVSLLTLAFRDFLGDQLREKPTVVIGAGVLLVFLVLFLTLISKYRARLSVLQNRVGELESLSPRGDSSILGELGIVGLYPRHKAASELIYKAVQSAQSRVLLLTTSNMSFISDSAFLEAVRQFLSRSRSAEVIVLHVGAGSESLRRRADDEGEKPTLVERDLETARERLTQEAAKVNATDTLTFLAYADYPVWKVTWIDDQQMFVSWYPPGGHAQESPVLILRPTEGAQSLYRVFAKYVEELRHRSTPVEPALEAKTQG